MSPRQPDGPLRVAVVGVGHLGKIHARIYAENLGADLVCVLDSDPARASAVAAELGCGVAQDLRALGELGERGELDAVSVVVPTSHHAEVAVPLLERGLSVLVEKPLAANLPEADAILAAAEKSGATLSVGHVERFQPGVRRVRAMGVRPRFIECHRLAVFNPRGVDVGVVHDLMIHDLDLVLHLIGSEVESLDAAGGTILTSKEDVASVRLVFKNGARANVTASRASLKPMRRFRLFSSEGYVSLDFTDNYGLSIRKGPEWERGRARLAEVDPTQIGSSTQQDLMTSGLLEVTQLELSEEQRPLQAELDSFLRAVREGTSPEVSGQDGRRALELADRISANIAAQAW